MLHGTASARLVGPTASKAEVEVKDEVRFAFDGDAVVFSAESDLIYKEKGLKAFLDHETVNARNPCLKLLSKWFLEETVRITEMHMGSGCRRCVLVSNLTAALQQAHERVVHTFRVRDALAGGAHSCRTEPEVTNFQRAMGRPILFDDPKRRSLRLVPSAMYQALHPRHVILPSRSDAKIDLQGWGR